MKPNQIKISFIFIIITVSFLLLTLWWPKNYLQVSFLNVGQGDAILIQTPAGENILIDGGPSNVLLSELAEVMPWWDRKIDYIIISHNHADHLEGLIELIRHYQIGEILTTAHFPEQDFLFNVWQLRLAEYDLATTVVQVGEIWRLSDNAYWQVLSADSQHENINDNSLVVRFSYGEIDWLFTGDLSSDKESDLLKQGLNLEAEILKVGHHGSKYSSSIEFLQAVKPKVCLIQVGENNKFGHPHAEALDRLTAVGCQVYRNDLEGAISLFSDGQNWWIKTK